MSETQPIPESADGVTEIEPKKLSKAELKRQEIFKDRMRRLIAAGKTPEEAYATIKKEDYARLPVDKKLAIMQVSFAQSLENVAKDIAGLHDNEKDLADVMDVNFRAFAKMLAKLGLSDQDQLAIIKECEDEVRAEREAAAAKRAAEAEEAKKKDLAETVDQPGETQIPEGAQVFGG